MSLLDRVFREPELGDDPPVLVDVGAAGGVAPVWRRIARHCIGVGFEPDARDAGKLRAGAGPFRRWVYCEGLVVPRVDPAGRAPFHLTRSPHCSSVLRPRADRLRDWSFADFFEVERVGDAPACELGGMLRSHGLTRVDWLKCDTQGLDLGIFMSLPEEWRRRVLAVDFEPGLIDAYEGEDKLWQTLRAMEAEPFWLCSLEPGEYPRGSASELRAALGGWSERWATRLAPGAPVYANARYLRDPFADADALDRRAWLLSWVFADAAGQHAQAFVLAGAGAERFGGGIFPALRAESRRRLRLAMLRRLPGWVWRRLGLPG